MASRGLGTSLALMTLMNVTGCKLTLPRDQIVTAKTYKRSMNLRTNGHRRSYLIHIPPVYDFEKPLPLVIVLHGAFDTARGMEKTSGFSELADREGFIVVYPNGLGLLGWLQHWNAGHCCGRNAAKGIDDVGFIVAVIDDLQSFLNIERSRIYMAGFSNGGMMVYRFAAERGDLLAAIAPLAASLGGQASENSPEWQPPAPVSPMPVIAFHGTADRHVPYAGGESPRQKPRRYVSAQESAHFWAQHNGCRPRPDQRYIRDDRICIWQWSDGLDHAPVVLYAISEWGHKWPGKYFTGRLKDHDSLKNFDAAEIIWDFFTYHRRQVVSAVPGVGESREIATETE